MPSWTVEGAAREPPGWGGRDAVLGPGSQCAVRRRHVCSLFGKDSVSRTCQELTW